MLVVTRGMLKAAYRYGRFWHDRPDQRLEKRRCTAMWPLRVQIRGEKRGPATRSGAAGSPLQPSLRRKIRLARPPEVRPLKPRMRSTTRPAWITEGHFSFGASFAEQAFPTSRLSPGVATQFFSFRARVQEPGLLDLQTVCTPRRSCMTSRCMRSFAEFERAHLKTTGTCVCE